MSPTFSPISLGGIGLATVTGTTGSPTVDTSSRAGKTIYIFNGSGSITVGTAGFAEIMAIGGGAGGTFSGCGGGAGGVLYDSNALLPSGTLTVTVGGGGAAGSAVDVTAFNGISSLLGNYVAVGGGIGAAGSRSQDTEIGQPGGSGGGGINAAGGPGITGQGNAGATGSGVFGGGGGAGAAGSGKVGGAGRQLSITGTATFYGGGGGGGNGDAGAGGSGGGGAGAAGTGNSGNGTANTGGGAGGGPGSGTNSGGIGGSGRVIVVIG